MTYEIHDITGETLEECLESLLVFVNAELLDGDRMLDVVRK